MNNQLALLKSECISICRLKQNNFFFLTAFSFFFDKKETNLPPCGFGIIIPHAQTVF